MWNPSIIQHLHSQIIKLRLSSHVYVATSLLNAYVVVSFLDACLLFDEMLEKNIVMWTTMIIRYSGLRDIQSARSISKKMPYNNILTWFAMIRAYINSRWYEHGLLLFQVMAVKQGMNPNEITVRSIFLICARIGSPTVLDRKSNLAYFVVSIWIGIDFN